MQLNADASRIFLTAVLAAIRIQWLSGRVLLVCVYEGSSPIEKVSI